MLSGTFDLPVPKSAAPRAKKKPTTLAKPMRTRLAKKGFLFLGSFEVADGELVVGESVAVKVPASAGVWFAFAAREGENRGAPKPDETIGALIACDSEEVEGLEELGRGAKRVGEVTVEGGTVAIVDAEWEDYGPLDKWTEKVEDPIAAEWGCRIGERGCQSLSGWGDGQYPVSTHLGRDGKARFVRVRFARG